MSTKKRADKQIAILKEDDVTKLGRSEIGAVKPADFRSYPIRKLYSAQKESLNRRIKLGVIKICFQGQDSQNFLSKIL